jgi:hypothetical protein
MADEGELVPDEKSRHTVLLAELAALQAVDTQSASSEADGGPVPRHTWRFPDNGPVRLICGQIPYRQDVRSTLASSSELNFTDLLSYADLDALFELFGFIRAQNPNNDNIRPLNLLDKKELTSHLVLLGGIAWNLAAKDYFGQEPIMPVRQQEVRGLDGDLFEVNGEWAAYAPKFSRDLEGTLVKRVTEVLKNPDDAKNNDRDLVEGLGELVQDVGLLARLPNPYNRERTLTICNGVFSRGVVGAVQCLTDPELRKRNEEYIEQRFGTAEQFCILMRVKVVGGWAAPPDLTVRETRLFEWEIEASDAK